MTHCEAVGAARAALMNPGPAAPYIIDGGCAGQRDQGCTNHPICTSKSFPPKRRDGLDQARPMPGRGQGTGDAAASQT